MFPSLWSRQREPVNRTAVPADFSEHPSAPPPRFHSCHSRESLQQRWPQLTPWKHRLRLLSTQGSVLPCGPGLQVREHSRLSPHPRYGLQRQDVRSSSRCCATNPSEVSSFEQQVSVISQVSESPEPRDNRPTRRTGRGGGGEESHQDRNHSAFHDLILEVTQQTPLVLGPTLVLHEGLLRA